MLLSKKQVPKVAFSQLMWRISVSVNRVSTLSNASKFHKHSYYSHSNRIRTIEIWNPDRMKYFKSIEKVSLLLSFWAQKDKKCGIEKASLLPSSADGFTIAFLSVGRDLNLKWLWHPIWIWWFGLQPMKVHLVLSLLHNGCSSFGSVARSQKMKKLLFPFYCIK